MLARDREMAEDEPAGTILEPLPGAGAVRTAEVGVDDDPALPLAANMVVGADRRNRGAGEVVAQEASASKMRLAPGIWVSSGDS